MFAGPRPDRSRADGPVFRRRDREPGGPRRPRDFHPPNDFSKEAIPLPVPLASPAQAGTGPSPPPRADAERPRPSHPERKERPHLAENELRYHGRHACMAIWKRRPRDIVRVYVLRELAEDFSDLLEFCAKNHKSYHLVGPGDLERLSDSVHHQGICMIARARRFYREEQFYKELGAQRTLVLFLDGVANPHNLGAILRSAAHFGVSWVCLPKSEWERIPPALYRTAEGAAEFVNLVRIEDSEKFLDRVQGQGFALYAFDPSAEAISLYDTRLNEKSLFVFGAEVEGLSGIVKAIVKAKLTIPGTGTVESLNVSVAAALAVAEFERQGRQRSVRIVKARSES